VKVGYFISKSVHYLPTILPLLEVTGGTIITLSKKAKRCIGQKTSPLNIQYYSHYKKIIANFEHIDIDVLVYPGFSVHYFRNLSGLKHVQVFHGTSDKPFNYHKSLKNYDLIVVPGQKMKEEIVKRNLADADKISITGYPKIDQFLHSDFDIESFRTKLGLDINRKTVLYSPTWSDPNRYSSFPRYIGFILRDLVDYNLIVKPHVNILKYRPWQIARTYVTKRKNCVIHPWPTSILPFMAVSDIMLTDISSVSHEYLPFDKPMIFLNPKPDEKIPNEHTWIWHCGQVINRGDGIRTAVDENIKYPDKFKKERKRALEQIFIPFDGKSVVRFKEALEKLLR
jgi:CDP-glycerol glycerophosphotransferase (TagB/SpsB family)